tara:strand:+ start:125 stop:304 length:180 start_codon:yes stop_codon:yes gene_type:complete
MDILNILKNYVKKLFGNHEEIIEEASNAADTAEKVVNTAKKVKKTAKKVKGLVKKVTKK